MLFTSTAFLFFLAIVLVVYYLIPRKGQWGFLLCASYVFYLFSGVQNLIYIIFTTLTTYWTTCHIGRLYDTQDAYLAENDKGLSREDKKSYKAKIKTKSRHWLIGCLILNFGLLAVRKLLILDAVSSAVRETNGLTFLNLALPLAISFYIFQSMGYLMDVYRGKAVPEQNLFKVALFVSFFPQLIQGPISRFHPLTETLFAEHRFDGRHVSFGLQRVLWGFFKKLVIADRMLPAVKTLVGSPQNYDGVYIAVIALFYAVQLYGDFTGGIDITIGIGQALGIRIAENFNRPFFSKNIAEYWRRWHISLSFWFRDYVFYPLSVCQPMLKLAKASRQKLGNGFGKRLTVYIASFVTWFATGAWHGFDLHFIVWGIANCVVIVGSQECETLYAKFHARFHLKHKWGYRLFEVLRTFWMMSFIRLLDWYPDVGLYFRQLGGLLIHPRFSALFSGSLLKLGISPTDYLILGGGCALMLTVSLIQRKGSVREKLAQRPVALRFSVLFLLFLSVLLMGNYGIGYDSAQFIYNRF